MQKLNITKEEFLTILNDIREQDKIDDNFAKALETVCSGYIVYGTENKNKSALLFVLNKLFYQPAEYDTIGWYLYECTLEDNSHQMSYNGYVVDINSDDLLWELLVAEFEEYANNNTDVLKNFMEKYGKKEKLNIPVYNPTTISVTDLKKQIAKKLTEGNV